MGLQFWDRRMRGVQLWRLQRQHERLPDHGGVRKQLRGDRYLQGHVSPAQIARTLQGQTPEMVRTWRPLNDTVVFPPFSLLSDNLFLSIMHLSHGSIFPKYQYFRGIKSTCKRLEREHYRLTVSGESAELSVGRRRLLYVAVVSEKWKSIEELRLAP